MKFIVIIFLIIILSACTGWRLRGSDDTNLLENSVYLRGKPGSTYSLIQQQLDKKQSLTSLPGAAFTLILKDEAVRRRTASVNASGSTEEYELTLTISYQILDANQAVLRPTTRIRIARSYIFDENDVVGKDKEELVIRKELQRAAARQILQQLQLLQRKSE